MPRCADPRSLPTPATAVGAALAAFAVAALAATVAPPALATTATAPPTKPKPAAPAAKAAKPTKAAKKAPAEAPSAPVAEAPEPVVLTDAQLAAASRVYVGPVECGEGVKEPVTLTPVDGRPGHFELTYGKQRWFLIPQETNTGAVRLEDSRTGVVWLQIPAKSMLLNTKVSQRILDGCTMSEQRPVILDARDFWVLNEGSAFGIAGLGRKD